MMTVKKRPGALNSPQREAAGLFPLAKYFIHPPPAAFLGAALPDVGSGPRLRCWQPGNIGAYVGGIESPTAE